MDKLNKDFGDFIQAVLDRKVAFLKMKLDGDPQLKDTHIVVDIMATIHDDGFRPYAILLSDEASKSLGDRLKASIESAKN